VHKLTFKAFAQVYSSPILSVGGKWVESFS